MLLAGHDGVAVETLWVVLIAPLSCKRDAFLKLCMRVYEMQQVGGCHCHIEKPAGAQELEHACLDEHDERLINLLMVAVP